MNNIQVNPGDPSALALRSGDRDFNGERQIYRPSPIVLAVGLSGESSIDAHLRVPVPDSRCRVKVTVMFVPTAGTVVPADLANAGSIWIAASDEDQDGTGGSGGMVLPVTNVEGTQAVPTPFPVAAGLSGYSRSFVTAADWLDIDLTINGRSDAAGAWVAQFRIQPDAVTLGWNEWDEIRRLFLPVRTA